MLSRVDVLGVDMPTDDHKVQNSNGPAILQALLQQQHSNSTEPAALLRATLAAADRARPRL